MLTDYTLYITAFLTGFFGSAHCIGMCGGLSMLLAINTQNKKLTYFYLNLGRILSYSTLGLLTGFLGIILSDIIGNKINLIFKLIGNCTIICIGIYLTGYIKQINILKHLNFKIWQIINPYTKKLIPITNIKQALITGIIWGYLPCGLVYATIIWSFSFGSILKSITLMTTFGLGTLPAILASMQSTLITKYLNKKPYIKIILGLLIIIIGLTNLQNSIITKTCH